MIDIGSINFLIKVPNLSEEDFDLYSSELFDQWESNVDKTLSLQDYSIFLEIEEGSISGKAKIAATASAIYLGIANYGGFISGVETIRSQISYVNHILFERAKSPFECNTKNTTVKSSGGSLSKLQSLFQKVQKGALSVEEAMSQAEAIFGEEGANIPGLKEQLQKDLENAPKYPVQLELIEEEQEACDVETTSSSRKPQKKRSPVPTPTLQQYRIEIWRESKKDKKHIKVTKK